MLRQWYIDYFALTKCHPGTVVLILEVYVCDHDKFCLGIYMFYIQLANFILAWSTKIVNQIQIKYIFFVMFFEYKLKIPTFL